MSLKIIKFSIIYIIGYLIIKMKSTETKVLENKKEKENKRKKTIMSTSENAKNNSYEEFRIEKLDYLFKLSEEDIETKKKR